MSDHDTKLNITRRGLLGASATGAGAASSTCGAEPPGPASLAAMRSARTPQPWAMACSR